MAKILFADDNEDFLHLACEVLRNEGFEVDAAKNGREAVNLLDKCNDYDLIITDLIMPDLDGIGVIRHANNMGIEQRIIALSGGGLTISSDDILKAVENTVQEILEKPINLDTLIEKVKSLI